MAHLVGSCSAEAGPTAECSGGGRGAACDAFNAPIAGAIFVLEEWTAALSRALRSRR